MERMRLDRQALLRLARGRVLTTAELARTLGLSPRGAAKAAFDLRRRGFLVAVKRGVYASVPLEVEPSGFHPDPLLAVHKAMGRRYAFSHWSAVQLLGGEQTVHRTVHVEAPGVRARRRKLGDLEVHEHPVPAHAWGRSTSRVRRGGASLLVTTPERTLVDLASLPGPAQDYDETLEAFRSLLPKVDPPRLTAMVRLTEGCAARARMGHYLARVTGETPEFTSVLSALERSSTRASPTYLGTRARAPSNRFDRRFKVVYPGV